MRTTLPTVLAAALALTGAAYSVRAETTTILPGASASAHAAVVRLAVNVCGANGCNRVQTHHIQHKKPPTTVAVKHT